ncbi:hypothetical protein [Methylacidiphilum caldifontis]|uniref:Chromosome partition protein Smc n=1 Tax=Methylacidiphilum caldifontis TaxID=2795386 RepID=A0A4Y8P9K1_9BACT|nr:hypothetical protein [Methylacidiphilum caldifontis]TFE67122.1 hypothetical protein A7Q10_09890 [Methylacidiphilum caldifontis]
MPITVEDISELIRLLREHPEWKERLRRELFPEDLVINSEIFLEVTAEIRSILRRLTEIQEKTEQRLNALAEAQEKTEQRLNALATRVEELAKAQEKTEQRLNALAEAQEKTEQRLNALAMRVEELAKAQEKTEQRLNALAMRVEELAKAQEKTEQRLNALAMRVEELAKAQEKTEQRLNALTQRVEELAEAQKKTEQTLHEFMEITNKRLLILERDMGELKKSNLESRIKLFPGSYLGVFLKKAKLFDPSDIAGILNEDHEELTRADALVEGITKYNQGKKILVVVESSWRAHAHDIERVLNRTKILLKYCKPVIPVVYSEQNPDETVVKKAEESKVVLLTKSKSLYWKDPIIYWENLSN